MEAKEAGKPFDFTHFILISKLHESTRKDSESKKKKAKGLDILWVNAEEEPISEVFHETPVMNDSHIGLSLRRLHLTDGGGIRRIFSPK